MKSVSHIVPYISYRKVHKTGYDAAAKASPRKKVHPTAFTGSHGVSHLRYL